VILRSLGAKLTAAFALLIFLSLFLAGTAFIFQLRAYQTQIALNRLADLALPMAFIERNLERTSGTPEQIVSAMADQANRLGVRLLLLDSENRVVGDTRGTLVGQTGRIRGGEPINPRSDYVWGVLVDNGQREIFLVPPSGRPAGPPGRPGPSIAAYRTVLTVPEQSVTAAWLELAPSLSIAAALSLVVSVAVSFLFSRSITRPLRDMQRASEAIARGEYDQQIAVRGGDEVAQLARTFNAMAREVGSSHRTLRNFLANVSHELRTPLTSIQGFSQAILDGTAARPDDQREAAEVIHEEADRMRRLVDDLLYLSKIESGQIAMRAEPVDLPLVLETAVRRARRRAEEVHVALWLHPVPPARLTGDEGRLSQVFDNLLDNALKFTPAGGTIAVQSRLTGGENAARLVVSVRNSGSYIPPEDLPHVFDRFYQVDKSRSRSGANAQGSGLGLAIAREIVQAHSGTVAANSAPETGTEFIVALPVSPPPPAPTPTAPAVAAARG
jgi:signal transduction histidine kinase